jgi:iron complex transport system substrate-binding protein
VRARVISVFALLFVLLPAPLAVAQVATPGIPAATACAATPAATALAFPLAVTDDVGREVQIAQPATRIVSIAPSNTEILFALGLEERIVGVDSFSNYPPAAAQKPQVGEYIAPDLERIVAAEPDLVLATGVHLETVLPALENLGLPVIVTEPVDLDGVLADIALLGNVTGESARARDLVCSLQTRVAAVAAAVAGAPPTSVFFELSPDLFTAGPGSFGDDLITRAGGANIAADAAQMWPQLSAEAVITANPEVILIVDHEAGITPELVAARPGWQGISAVEQRRIVPIVSDLVARPGPRVVDGLEAIAAALHPDQFPEANS